MDDDAAEPHPGFLPHLAAHGLLDGFGRLDEAGQGAVPVGGPALLPAEEHAVAVGRHDGHDDGGVRAREAQVRHALAGGAVGARGGGDGDGAADAGLEQAEVGGWAGALGAGVDGEGRLAARGAEGVACVPVEEGACLGVGGGGGGGEAHVGAAFDEGEAAGNEGGDEGGGRGGVAAFGGDVEGEERGAGVEVFVGEAIVGGAFVKAEEDELRDGVGGVVGGDEVGFGARVGVAADEGLHVGVGDGGELGGVFH